MFVEYYVYTGIRIFDSLERKDLGIRRFFLTSQANMDFIGFNRANVLRDEMRFIAHELLSYISLML